MVEPEDASDGLDSVTAPLNVFDVLGSVIDRAVLDQNWEEASRLLRPCFEKIRQEVKSTRELDASIREPVCAFAINLAGATGEGEWLDTLVAIHTSLGRPMPAQVMAMLPELVRTVEHLDFGALEDYAITLRGKMGTFTPVERQLCAQLDTVLVLAAARHR